MCEKIKTLSLGPRGQAQHPAGVAHSGCFIIVCGMNGHLLSAYCVPGGLLCLGDTARSKMDRNPVVLEGMFQGRKWAETGTHVGVEQCPLPANSGPLEPQNGAVPGTAGFAGDIR